MFDDKQIEASQARMESARYGFDSVRGEIASLVLPQQQGFNRKFGSQGQLHTNHQYDEYAALALEDGVSAFEGFVIPRGQKWQKIILGNERLMESVVVQQWLETIETRLFALRNDPKSGFTNAVHTSAQSLFAFGEQSMWVDKRFDPSGRFAGLSYQSEHLDGIFVENDAEGSPMRVHRKFTLTAEQLTMKFREGAPPKAKEAMAAQPAPRSNESFEIVHVIERNDRMMPGRIDPSGMPWRACYYSMTDRKTFKSGGYRTMRRIVSRFDRAPGEDYGRGPAMRVLPAIRASQIMMQDRVLATEMAVKRPMLAPSDDLDSSVIDVGPFGITYGGIDDRGNKLLVPLDIAADLSGASELHGEIRATIDKAFYRDLLQINRELKTHITAARTMEEIGEKGILLAPLARQEQEWFAPMMDVELDLMWEEGLLDDMPAEVIEYFQADGGVHARYDNNLSRMQEAGAAAGYLRTAEQIGLIAQFDPSVVGQFTREYPLSKVVPGLASVNGIPARWRATDEEKEAVDEAEQQKVMLDQLLQAAPALGGAAKNIAEAEAIGGG
ncbi:portal protein [Sphingomonas alpina]|uniref:Phage head-tail adapter protein n=1 Tax=Sphingomonas alpina TaxID=653931 RepID=A0A7H0LHV1_9SPHN|nr:portal protein [Sphingomonas alpina]QNQ09254.1 hypothetical protein H3Z74_21710 [Sphingomonas alpina]